MVSDPEVLSLSPHLLNLMDFRVHEASKDGHLLKGAGEVLGPLVVIISMLLLEICPPHTLDEVRILFEGFQMALLEEFQKGPSLSLPLVKMLFWKDV